MRRVVIHDKAFEPYITAEQIQKRVSALGKEIGDDLRTKEPLLLCVLNGSFMFASDLMKTLSFPAEITFVKLTSYLGVGSSGTVKQLIGLNEQIKNRYIVIVEDIIDTGITMRYLLDELWQYNPADIKIVTLLFKEEAFKGNFKIDYTGFVVPNKFLVGYGLDYDGFGRNYPELYTVVNQ